MNTITYQVVVYLDEMRFIRDDLLSQDMVPLIHLAISKVGGNPTHQGITKNNVSKGIHNYYSNNPRAQQYKSLLPDEEMVKNFEVHRSHDLLGKQF